MPPLCPHLAPKLRAPLDQWKKLHVDIHFKHKPGRDSRVQSKGPASPYHNDTKHHDQVINKTPGGHTGESHSEWGQQDEVWQPQRGGAVFPADVSAISLLCFSNPLNSFLPQDRCSCVCSPLSWKLHAGLWFPGRPRNISNSKKMKPFLAGHGGGKPMSPQVRPSGANCGLCQPFRSTGNHHPTGAA